MAFGRTLEQSWSAMLGTLRDQSIRQAAYADLLEDVDPSWRPLVEVHNSVHQMLLQPLGGSLNAGRNLWVKKTGKGFSMKVTDNPGFTLAQPIATARPCEAKAPEALSRMLSALIPEPQSTGRGMGDWTRAIHGFRSFAEEATERATLMDGVDSRWRQRTESYYNSRDLGVLRRGDSPDDGEAVWINRVADGWEFERVSQRKGSERAILRVVGSSLPDGPSVLNELIAELAGEDEPRDRSAQDAYRILLKTKVGPFLRAEGFKGPSGSYTRDLGDYLVGIGFQKSRYSTVENIDFCVHAWVVHRETRAQFEAANASAWELGREHESAPAGDWSATYPAMTGWSGGYWLTLRPREDLEAFGDSLVEGFREWVFPEIDRQLALPHVPPTPPELRAERPTRGELNRQHLSDVLGMLNDAGVDVT